MLIHISPTQGGGVILGGEVNLIKSSLLRGMVYTKCIAVDQGRVFLNFKVHDPLGRVLVLGHYHKSDIPSENENILYSQAYIRQTKCIVMMTKEGST